MKIHREDLEANCKLLLSGVGYFMLYIYLKMSMDISANYLINKLNVGVYI